MQPPNDEAASDDAQAARNRASVDERGERVQVQGDSGFAALASSNSWHLERSNSGHPHSISDRARTTCQGARIRSRVD